MYNFKTVVTNVRKILKMGSFGRKIFLNPCFNHGTVSGTVEVTFIRRKNRGSPRETTIERTEVSTKVGGRRSDHVHGLL